MYQAFDKFLKTPTWHTPHAFDTNRFNNALALVVDEDDFNPDAMGEYMRKNGQKMTMDKPDVFDKAIDRLVAKAWAVKDYLNRD